MIRDDDENQGFTSFEDILDVDANEVERPKPVPVGSYQGMIDGLPTYDKSSKKQTPFVQWNVKLVAPLEDVDLEELAAVGGLGNRYARVTIYLPNGKNDRYKIKDFCEKLGIPVANLQEMVDATPNQYIGVVMKHTILDDGTTIAEVKKTFSLIND